MKHSSLELLCGLINKNRLLKLRFKTIVKRIVHIFRVQAAPPPFLADYIYKKIVCNKEG